MCVAGATRGFRACIKYWQQLSTGDVDGRPVCDQPSQGWCTGLTTVHVVRQYEFDFTNEVQISEKMNINSLVISADPIWRETCNPAGGGFCRTGEIQLYPDSRIRYPPIPTKY